jgi:5-methylcytosine-specific restriction endonuclease McrA
MAEQCSICRGELPDGRKNRRCRDCDREYQQRRFRDNPELHEAAKERWRTNARKNYKNDRKNYKSAWREANKGRVREHNARWVSKNRDRVLELQRNRRRAHPEKEREKKRRRRARKRGAEVGVVDYAAVIARTRGLCSLCNCLVPEGYGHFDHIVPLDKGGAHSTENLQLLCYHCNCSKGAKLPEEFKAKPVTKKPLPKQPHLLNPDWTARGYR